MNTTRIKFLFYFGIPFLLFVVLEIWPAVLVFGCVLVLGFFVTSKENNKEWEDQITHGDSGQKILCYYGDELNFEDDIITDCLTRYLPFYCTLNSHEKEKFKQRLVEFMRCKIFKIHDKKGFKEMPILVSAASIQLSFGLDNYLLPQFEFIHIYPEEFINTASTNHFLKGNVSGQSINISWKHFLQDFLYPDDGQNVGLHEMAHAYYYQNFMSRENRDSAFVVSFPKFNSTANKVFEQEKKPGNDLFSDYGLRNFQEFWAESIELFFEKPAELNSIYPDLYSSLCILLNQDPVNNIRSLRS